ncbi:MAG: hypothetical protein IJN42_02650, partial [Clostridia bacterium]|nr:hypothetical protein [Clostridia bacterium]
DRYFLALDEKEEKLLNGMQRLLETFGRRFEKDVIKLDALSPLATLARGYAAVYDEEKKMISDFSGIAPGMRISVQLKDKSAQCLVEELE